MHKCVFVKESYLTYNKRGDSVFCKHRGIIILIENLHHDPVHALQQQRGEKKTHTSLKVGWQAEELWVR